MSVADSAEIGLPEALERAASALPRRAGAIRPANGDPGQLARELDPAGSREVLAWLLEHEPAAGAELALAWAEDPGATDGVIGLSPDALPKPARKALRRALHRLRSRGVQVPEAARPATVAKLARLDESLEEARLTELDPQGVRLAYLATAHPAGGARLFQLALDETRGVLDFDLFEAGRSRVRRFLRETERRASWPAVAVPAASLRALVARVAAQASADSRPPRGFQEWRGRLCEVCADAPTPGALVREALGADPDADLGRVVGWVREGEIGPWPPPRERLRALLEQLDEIAKGVVIASSAARAERVDAALGESLTQVYDAAFGEQSARRLEETAYVLWRRAREADARVLLAAADAFRAGDPQRDAIARAMLETLLAPALERARRGDPEPVDEARA